VSGRLAIAAGSPRALWVLYSDPRLDHSSDIQLHPSPVEYKSHRHTFVSVVFLFAFLSSFFLPLSPSNRVPCIPASLPRSRSTHPTHPSMTPSNPPKLGILQLKTTFPRPPGDVSHPASWGSIPVVVRVVEEASSALVVGGGWGEELVDAFVREGKRLMEEENCVAFVTSCGFVSDSASIQRLREGRHRGRRREGAGGRGNGARVVSLAVVPLLGCLGRGLRADRASSRRCTRTWSTGCPSWALQA
jgi:hypothetical protein